MTEVWNIYENQQSRFTFAPISTCLGQAASPKPGQGGVVVMYEVNEPIGFDSNASGHFPVNDNGLATTVKVSGVGGVATDAHPNTRTIVRRLTPLECERLMGWPDNYTAHGIDDNGQPVDIANTNRYRICGNGIVATVTEWIGRRLPDETAERQVAA